MKKKFTLEINNPCSENFDKMVPGANGSFCNSCAKNVIDLSRKTNSEVAKFIAETKEKNICARLKVTQLEEEFEHNEISRMSNLKYAAVAASVLLASNISAQEKTPVETEINCASANTHKMGKIVYNQVAKKEISLTIKGKLSEAKTNKPFDSEAYPDLRLFINGSESTLKVNSRTGEFSIVAQVLKDSKSLTITISGNDYYLSKEIPFTIKSVRGNVLQQNIIIAAEELSKIYIAGGLGINYSKEK